MNNLISRMILLFITLLLSFSLSSPYYPTVHEVLRSKGLPAGLLPQEVDSYILHNDGRLEVFLAAPCYAKFETNVHFEAVVRANLSYGSLIGVEGLSQKELFLWLQVKDIVVENPNSGVIVFDIGVAFKQLSLSLFEDPPKCNPDGVLKKKMRRDRGFEAQI
ncbi:unnamed protein product [Arabidopsis lyrata]|uniref:DUF538 family protein n=3 Tax=Arabidopsis TaxID=3701 RepID=D7MUA4_ARALL|nr:uncharacterized protein LOC9302123 [Arabidopsis lyrata subsp. lyrata]EFH40597.1 hypothetical protein ARALYDRAFT_495533 [Arabidopsis lyrata subsp. lyrata]KAG7534219.1 hypothetical protein ISN45_Aa08g018010 [Arabidopsis thaliana x Arabidopsis arenosa]KAG7537921.1 hypothetical protein ISN44_As13g017660 [Arabidopsis suecica]CAH8279660.1 unnamed protein product [Arabidopsis lyrata]|eukprot:XP_002864338.1 uncharacterized protein LOC9302123 [Arabidopsis lyrata subsp. lyrata]